MSTEKFDAAVAVVQKLPKSGPLTTSNDDKLRFYSLFKQATVGDVNTPRPGMFALIEKAKWDAWKSVEGTSKEDAMQKYVDVLLEIFSKAGEEVDIDAWLNGPDLDPSVKENLAKLTTK